MENTAAKGHTFVLVHGSWHGSWCWDKVVFWLQQRGHNAVVLDLPGRAGDPKPPGEITLAHLVDKVCRVVALQPHPVVLVGWSMGGMVVTQAAEYCFDRIKTLVYICGFMLANGQTLADVYASGGPTLTASNLIVDEAAGTLDFKPDAPLREIFYHDCSDADFERARAMLVPEPNAPRLEAVRTSNEHFGQVPRVYIETLQDRSIPIELQRRMIATLPPSRVITMDTGHSPFLAAPEELADHLAALNERPQK